MIKSKRKEKNSSYYASFYQYKRRPPLLKYCLVTALLFLCTLIAIKVKANESTPKSNTHIATPTRITLGEVGSGQLLLKPTQLSTRQLAGLNNSSHDFQAATILHSDVSFDINGLIATVTFTQSFVNPSTEPLDGVYAFPLPDKSAVNHLKIQIGSRLIEGQIMEKVKAKQAFVVAQKSGKRASLVQQQRPNLFTNHIANIGAHEQVTVTLTYLQHVQYDQGRFYLRFPMSITPRYQPRHRSSSQLSQLLLASTLSTWQQPLNGNIAISASLKAGIPITKIDSRSHTLSYAPTTSVEPNGLNSAHLATSYQITLDKGTMPMDRDFYLSWYASPSTTPQVSLFTQELNNEQYALAMLIPPTVREEGDQSTEHFARDVTFVIDTSGSMQGASIKQAKQSLLFALNTLTPQDRFNIISFASHYQTLFESNVFASAKNLDTADNFIQRLSANGGTEMYQPLALALAMNASADHDPDVIRQIIFITDGAVGNELELFQLIQSSPVLPRLFTVGIGAAPNGYFMRKAAQFGKGSYTYISDLADIKPMMSELLKKISRPALRNIAIQFQPLHLGTIEQYPKKLPDLYHGEPLMVAFKTALTPTSIQVFGEQANRGWHQELMFNRQQKSQGITSIWAREKIEDLMDTLVLGKAEDVIKKQVLNTSLLHQVMSPYSSFIAIEKSTMELPLSDDLASEQAINKKDKLFASANHQLAIAVMPQTALGWQLHFIIGFLIIGIGAILYHHKPRSC
ncbi:marine proteobacterial sortase target protein [Thalassotalea atypica]|uniref:marine proteobacterial sortase target protein n=1 Tax=Thalassotalea atypica TaxID=2054316 RepID=UPI0025732CF5|nr:marine proteobacterial sortase target protein [Thalassotalea atypica]